MNLVEPEMDFTSGRFFNLILMLLLRWRWGEFYTGKYKIILVIDDNDPSVRYTNIYRLSDKKKIY